MEDAVSITKVNCSIVQPRMGRFVTQALDDLTKKPKGSQIEETLRRAEEVFYVGYLRDVDEENPRFDRWRGVAFDINNLSCGTSTSPGLELLRFVRFKIKHEDTRRAIDTRLKWLRHCLQPGERDHRHGRREPATFHGNK
ncbi:hypothetical protein N7447_005540 [Penicillium robsamsonii]|uniref:uncharacterized protein n=1 Tax=Penicillium robsamsonii TaxID=1792511 RepID=UPI0025469BF9|nr:uncharacterized protein N7447_005540 [Penicillium robsamsonii]KAJ5823200.1 hypothetical protein N7447_005540 [Penicillium robsamsonii]